MKVSVVMASWLANPQRQDLDKKFVRAVKTFLNQTYEDKELIIVSDGCQKTIDLYNEHFKKEKNIKFFASPKQIPYSGGIRDIGIKMADGDIICYLDSDDLFSKTHLQTIVEQFDINKYDWVYYNDYLAIDPDFKKFQLRWVDPRWASIGTSAIAHKNFLKYPLSVDIQWFSGYGHDFLFVLKLASAGTKYKKLEKNPGYIVAHTGNSDW